MNAESHAQDPQKHIRKLEVELRIAASAAKVDRAAWFLGSQINSTRNHNPCSSMEKSSHANNLLGIP